MAAVSSARFDVGGRRFQQHVDACPQQAVGLDHDDDRHDERGHGVGPLERGVGHEHGAGAQHGERAQGVTTHVQRGGAHVEVTAALAQHQGGKAVDHEGDGGHGHDEATVHGVGWRRRTTLSTTMATVITAMTAVLARAARIGPRW